MCDNVLNNVQIYSRSSRLASIFFGHFAGVLEVLKYPTAIGRRFAHGQRVVARSQRVDVERVVFCEHGKNGRNVRKITSVTLVVVRLWLEV